MGRGGRSRAVRIIERTGRGAVVGAKTDWRGVADGVKVGVARERRV